VLEEVEQYITILNLIFLQDLHTMPFAKNEESIAIKVCREILRFSPQRPSQIFFSE
jgi:hypothetical protein